MPLSANHEGDEPCPDRSAAATEPNSILAPVQFAKSLAEEVGSDAKEMLQRYIEKTKLDGNPSKPPTDNSSKPGSVGSDPGAPGVGSSGEAADPDAAFVDILFSNGSRLGDDGGGVDVGFSGTYSVSIRRTGAAVEVALTLLVPQLDALTPERLDLSVSGPSATRLLPHDGGGAEESSNPANGNQTVVQRELLGHKAPAKPERTHVDQLGWKHPSACGTAARGGDEWADSVYPVCMNGSALTGADLCGVHFNVSGVFIMNWTATDDVTTVTIRQPLGIEGTPRTIQKGSAAGEGSSVASQLGLFTVVGAVLVLLGAVFVWRMKHRRSGSFVRVTHEGGYGAIERAREADSHSQESLRP